MKKEEIPEVAATIGATIACFLIMAVAALGILAIFVSVGMTIFRSVK